MKFFKILALTLLACSLQAKIITVTDVAGREVSFESPAKRPALAFYYTDYLAVSGTKQFDKVVGIAKTVWKDWTPLAWKLYKKAMPQIDSLPDFGEPSSNSFASEKLISLEPDVLVISQLQYNAIKDQLEPLNEAKIPVVVVDFHKGSLENHSKSIEIFGLISGEQKRAKEIIDDYKKRLDLITSRTKDIKDRVKIYAEFDHGNKKATDIGLTYSHFMWGALIDKAGAINIADGVVNNYGTPNPELVLERDPDVIFLVGSDYQTGSPDSQAMTMGNNFTFEDANSHFKYFINRSGWSELKAVKSGNLFSGDHAILRTITDIFMLEFVAKAAYPELFKDLHPQKDYLDFYQKYMPIKPQGIFMMKYKDPKFN